MKNLLESIIFDRNRFKKLAGINENVSGAADYPPESAANDLAKEIAEFNKKSRTYGDVSKLREFLIIFLEDAAAKLGKELPEDIDDRIDISSESVDDGFGEYMDSGEVHLRGEGEGLKIATWSAHGDGYKFSVDDFNKANFKEVYEQLFDLK